MRPLTQPSPYSDSPSGVQLGEARRAQDFSRDVVRVRAGRANLAGGVLRFSELHGWLWIPTSEFANADPRCTLLYVRVLTEQSVRDFFGAPQATFDGFEVELAPGPQ